MGAPPGGGLMGLPGPGMVRTKETFKGPQKRPERDEL